MTRTDAIERLRTHRPELRRLGVDRLYLFGSVARDEARDDSDVDLFFETDDPKFDRRKTQEFLEGLHPEDIAEVAR